MEAHRRHRTTSRTLASPSADVGVHAAHERLPGGSAICACLAAVVGLTLLLVACGSSPTPQPTATVVVTAPPATGSPSATPSTASSSVSATTTLSVYFMRPIGGAQPDHGPFIATAHRAVPATGTPATVAMRALLAGPSARERSIGMTSVIPSGTRLLGLTISSGVATVDLSSEFGAGSRASDAEVVYTLTQFSTVKTVVLKVGGTPLADAGGKRSRYEALTPPIFVERPAPFDTLGTTVKVAGTANVFEATFQWKAVDPAGHRIDGGTVTATSGSGTRGTFAFTVTSDAWPSAWRLVVWDASAENGSALHTVRIPLASGG